MTVLLLLLAGTALVVPSSTNPRVAPGANFTQGPRANSNSSSLATGPLLPFAQGANPVDTLVLANNTLVQGNLRAPHGTSPDLAVNDTANGDLYVSDYGAITVLDPTNDTIATTISVPGAPETLAFDAANGAIYAANVDTDQLDVINGTTNTVVAVVPVGSLPVTLAVDPVNGNVYVACAWSASVSVVSTANNTLVANLSVGAYPEYLAVDSANGEVFVGVTGTNNLSVISPTNETVFANISLGTGPGPELFDAATGDVYVSLGSSVKVVNGTTNTIVSTFGTGSGPKQPVLDPATGDLYIPCYSSDNFTVYSPTSGKVVQNIALFTRPISTAFDPANKDLYVTEQPPAILPIRFQVVSTAKQVVIANITGGEYLFSVYVGGPSGTVFVSDFGYGDIEVVSPTTNSVVATLPISTSPVQVTADPAGDQLFVGDESTSSVWAISGATGRILRSWQLGTGPSELVYDPVSEDVYVAAYGSHSVTVVNGRTDATVATLQTGGGPEAFAVDPVNGCVYVANVNSGNLTVINATTNRVAATVGLGAGAAPWMLTVDTKSGNVYVFDSTQVAVVSGKTNAVLTHVTVGSLSSSNTWSGGDVPVGMAYDSVSDAVYVAEFWVDEIYVISAGNNSVVATDRAGAGPLWTSVGADGRFVYVSNTNSANVTVVNATTNAVVGSIPVGSSPGPVFDDPARGDLYVADSGSGNLTLANSTNQKVVGSVPVGNGTESFAMDPATGDLWTANPNQGTLSVLSPSTFSITFNETGLPAGRSWSVTLGGLTLTSSQSEIPFNVPNGTGYLYAILGLTGFTWSPGSGLLNLSGQNLTVNVTFRSAPDHYLVTFVELGLAPATDWAATLNGSTSSSSSGPSIGFSLGNGTGYTFQVAASTGVAPRPSNGTFNVTGAPLTINISFALLYQVTFTESGLPTGQTWNLTLNGTSRSTTAASLAFAEPNGSYGWTVQPIAGYSTLWSGTVEVNGANLSTNLAFLRVTYRVAFAEAGLPTGALWNVSVGTNAGGSVTPTIAFAEPNGTYNWSVVPIPGFTTNWSGSVRVAALPVTVNISFTRVNYTLTFAEAGLPAGTPWTVQVTSSAGAVSTVSSTTYDTFVVPNGSIAWAVTPIGGYATNWSGVTAIQGAPGRVNLTFRVVDYSVTFHETGLPAGTAWEVSLNGSNLTSTGSSIVFSLPNGTYPWTIPPVPGAVTTLGGSVGVQDAAATVSIVFTRVYAVLFTESGLPVGTAWWVNLTGGAGLPVGADSTGLELPNGTYEYTVATADKRYEAAGGSLQVQGSAQQIPIAFSLVSFRITFTANGLPSATTWWLNVTDGPSLSGTGASLVAALANGTYAYTVATTDRTYDAAGGSVQVAGKTQAVAVAFSEVVFDVVFAPSGLAAGTNWSVQLGGMSRAGTGNLTFNGLPNGTYHFTIGAVAAYTAGENSSNVTIDGRSPTVTVTFVRQSISIPTSLPPSALPLLEYAVVALLVVGALAGGAFVWARRRRSRATEPPPPEAEEPPTEEPLEGEP